MPRANERDSLHMSRAAGHYHGPVGKHQSGVLARRAAATVRMRPRNPHARGSGAMSPAPGDVPLSRLPRAGLSARA